MKMLTSLFLVLLTITSCSTRYPDARDEEHKAPHGGVLVKGKKYFLEIVGTAKNVQLYPLKEDESGKLVPIPMKSVRLVAEYSPDRSKADYSLNLKKRHEHYFGKIDKKGESTYQVHVDMKVGNSKEEFIYNLQSKDLKKKL